MLSKNKILLGRLNLTA